MATIFTPPARRRPQAAPAYTAPKEEVETVAGLILGTDDAPAQWVLLDETADTRRQMQRYVNAYRDALSIRDDISKLPDTIKVRYVAVKRDNPAEYAENADPLNKDRAVIWRAGLALSSTPESVQ